MCVRVLEKKEKMCCLAIVHDAIKLGLSRDSRFFFFFFFSLAVFVKQNATSGWTSAPSVMVALRRPLFFHQALANSSCETLRCCRWR